MLEVVWVITFNLLIIWFFIGSLLIFDFRVRNNLYLKSICFIFVDFFKKERMIIVIDNMVFFLFYLRG